MKPDRFDLNPSAGEMRAILKKRDALIVIPDGTIWGYRAREGLTQHQLAKMAGLKQGHLEGNKRPVGVKVAKRLAKALRCDYLNQATSLNNA